jgi:RNA polymerase sigma-70 factor, ECF subfamily
MKSDGFDGTARAEEFVRLYQQYERQIYGYILSLLPNIADADDVSQKTSLRLWEEFDQFDSSKDFGSWGRAIAYYEVLTHRKTINRQRIQFNSELVNALATRVAARSKELASRQDYLVKCLAKLNEFGRQVIWLYYSSQMTARLVAEKLGRSVASVEKALERSRHTLYDCIEAEVRREERP